MKKPRISGAFVLKKSLFNTLGQKALFAYWVYR